MAMTFQDFEDYQKFTKPSQLHKAINTLRGLVAGISSDGGASSSEMAELAHWCELHSHLRDRHPFSELLPVVECACADGVVTDDEASDILWLCSNFADSSSYYDVTTSSIQFLAGLVHGIMADGELSDREVSALSSWMTANSFLSGTYPFDEINGMLRSILADKKVSDEERGQLMALFSDIIDFTSSFNLNQLDFDRLKEKYSISGVCAADPDICFEGKNFCFTGESCRAKRSEIAEIVTSLGGTFRNDVSKKVDYLIVGSSGNPCWAYACYGRKIEDAIGLRRSGVKIVIVNENDFWNIVDARPSEGGLTCADK